MSYWDALATARERLAAGALAEAEAAFATALDLRERSPGRVFLSETVTDAARRLWGRARRAEAEAGSPGRWPAAAAAFRADFLERAGAALAAALGHCLAAGPTADDFGLLVEALRLTTGSRLHPADGAAAARLLPAAVAAAARAGRPFDPALIRADLPLAEADRLALATQIERWLDRLAAGGGASAADRAALARPALRLLDAAWFSPAGPYHAERSWRVARLTDGHAGDAAAAIPLYRACLALPEAARARAEAARVRLIELLANLDAQHLPVPRHDEARALLEAGPPADEAAARRFAAARRALEWRSPADSAAETWASLAMSSQGLTAVLWRDDEPRDLALWRAGDEAEPLRRFLRPCRGRLVRWDEGRRGLWGEVGEECAGEPAGPFAAALLEPWLPADGPTPAAVYRLGQPHAAAWRAGWEPQTGHPLLAPPSEVRTEGADGEATGPSAAAGAPELADALAAGFLWLACGARLRALDPLARAGVRRLGARGDRAAAFVSRFRLAEADGPPGGVDAAGGGAGWRLPPLAERADPLLGAAVATGDGGPAPTPAAGALLLASSRPAAALRAWGAAEPAWRVVLDREARLADLAAAAAGRRGITLIPPDGEVHAVRAALAWLESPPATGEGGAPTAEPDLLPLFHWLRLCECHNGDLLDHLRLRPRPAGVLPVVDRHAALAGSLPRVRPGATGVDDPWAGEYAARARRSGVVAGPASRLCDPDPVRDALWGVGEEGGAAWVFLDSARIHWQLRRAGLVAPAELHAMLARRGRRHLSLLRDGRFLGDDLAALLAEWLAPYGAIEARLARGGEAAPLALACGGVAPDARVLADEAGAGGLGHVARLRAGGERPVVALPARGAEMAALWRAIAAGRLGLEAGDGAPACLEPAELWSETETAATLAGARLVVPVLDSLGPADAIGPLADRPDAWALADRARAAALAQERRLCSLEVNALLACGAATVDVADPRWCRRFPLPGGGGAAELPAGGTEALAAVGVAGAAGYELPQASPSPMTRRGPLRRRGAAPLAGLEAVAAWRREQAAPAAPAAAWATVGEPEREAEGATRGARLCDGDGAAAWTGWMRRVAAARERGETGAWLLAVGPTPPAGAGALAAAFPTAAPTVAMGDGSLAPRPPLGPVLWTAPETLADPGLRAAIAARPPLAAFALGLEGWLPDDSRPRLGAAVALRFLARDLPRAELCLGGLAGPWRRLLAAYLAEGAAGGAGAEAELLADPEGEFLPGGSAVARCPDCAGAVPLVGARPACATCGLDLSTWQGGGLEEGRRRAVVRARLEALRGRTAAGRELVFHLKSSDVVIVKEELADMGLMVAERPGRLVATGADGAWHLLLPTDDRLEPPVGRTVRFGLADGSGAGPDGGDGPPLVASHPDDLDTPRLPAPAERLARAVALVTAGAAAEPPEWARACRGALPAPVVEALTGLPAEEVAASLAALAWLSVLETGREPAGGGADDGPARLRLAVPLAELEYRLRRAAELAAARLPSWLEGAAEGLPVACDLAAGGEGDAEEDLAWLDRFLLAMSLRLRGAPPTRGGGDLFRGTTGTEELLWRAPEGALFSTHRLLGTLGRPRAVAERLALEAERFAAAAARLLATAVRDGGGARVDLPAGTRRPDAVVTVGCLLGAWWREGPTAAGDLDASSLAWLAGAPAAARARAVALLADGDAWRARQAARLGAAPGSGAGAASAPAGRRATSRGAAVEATAPETARQTARLLGGAEPGWLVLRGPAGTGRLAAVAAGLADAAASGALRPGEVCVWCPSPAVAARVHLTWRRDVDAAVAPALFIAPEGTPPAGAAPPVGRHLPADPARETALLIDAEALPRETRFAVQQRYRGGRLLATVDPAAADAPWEHLFLTTPSPDRVIDCVDQRAQTRRVWEETRQFAPGGDGRPARGRALRRERGEAVAHGAASLDEVVALLAAEQTAGRLGRRSAVVAAARDDLLYVGRSLAARGWLPVLRWELDALLLPGALEFVAVVSDIAALAGRSDGARAPLLPALLDPPGAAAYARWLAAAEPLAAAPLAEIHARIVRGGWAAPWLARPEVRRRVERLAREAGAEDPGRFVKRPLWAAWRLELADWLAVPPATPHAPVVTLATPETCGATGADTLVYLCLGSEARQRHYRVFARATERVMVLYQEASPLAGDESTAAD